VLPSEQAVARPRDVLLAGGRYGPSHRAPDRPLQLDSDRTATAHPRIAGRARHESVAGAAVLSVLPDAELEPGPAERQAAAPGHRVGDRPQRDREARLLHEPHADGGA